MFVRNSYLMLTFLMQALTLPILSVARHSRHLFSSASAATAPWVCGEFCFPRAIEAYEQVIDAMLCEQESSRG